MNDILDVLLTNLKNHPWHLYPDFKINEETGKALVERLEEPASDPEEIEKHLDYGTRMHHYLYGVDEYGNPELVEVEDDGK